MRKKRSESIGLFFHSIQDGLLSTIFIFNSNIGGIRIFFTGLLQATLFYLVAIPNAIASLLTLFSFGKAKNKNLGETFDLIYVPTTAALVFSAIFAGFSLAVTHSLFLIAVGSGIVYHSSLGLYSAYHWWKTPNNSPSNLKLKNLYKNNMINNGISSLMGTIIITGILTTMVFAPLLSASLLVIAGIGTAAMLLLTTAYAIGRHFKQPITPPPPAYTNLTTLSVDAATPEISVIKGYYYCKFRSEKLSGCFDTDKAFLRHEINNKITELQNQIDRSENKRSESFWPEKSKREAKITFLKDILEPLNKHFPSPDNSKFTKTIDQILSTARGKVFQSFFRAKGDMGDIVDVINAFVNHYKYISEVPPREAPQFSHGQSPG